MFGDRRAIMERSKNRCTKTLAELGHGFNDEGQLRQLDEDGVLTDKPFEFKVFPDQQSNQNRYEDIGEAVTDYIYDLLEKKGFVRLPVPIDSTPEKGTFVFSTAKDLVNVEKLFIIFHGSGVVRAGQWSRSLIINHSMEAGSQFPYIEEAQKMGFDVLLMNTNDIYRNGELIENWEPYDNAEYVFEKYVVNTKAKTVSMVAHSYGGQILVLLSKQFKDFFIEKVHAVGMTDSTNVGFKGPKEIKRHMHYISRNWQRSTKPLDSTLYSIPGDWADADHVSAGTNVHEWTSFYAKESLFEFIQMHYDRLANNDRLKKLREENERLKEVE
uniref:Arb2 domain-containing protein n=1 Tax=Nyssomyia neivai TaxID=330878 RepID=A0A1L8DAM3_9DIPT